MAYGKPIIASRIGGLPELIQEGQSGVLFEAGNQRELGKIIADLLADNSKLRQMGLAGRARVKSEFTSSYHNNGLFQIYKSLCRARGAGPGVQPSFSR